MARKKTSKKPENSTGIIAKRLKSTKDLDFNYEPGKGLSDPKRAVEALRLAILQGDFEAAKDVIRAFALTIDNKKQFTSSRGMARGTIYKVIQKKESNPSLETLCLLFGAHRRTAKAKA